MRAPQIFIDPHPSLEVGAFTSVFPEALGSLRSPDWLTAGLALEAAMPLERSEDIRTAVRDLLRHGGYKPTGRGKPASEYLVRAADTGKLASINPAVDACNVVSLHSGLPISLVDLDRSQGPFRICLADPGARFVFNLSGQEIDVAGLLCLHDAEGPCANAVKDSQRTKTTTDTTRTLSVVWGVRSIAGRTAQTVAWYREQLEKLGGTTRDADCGMQ